MREDAYRLPAGLISVAADLEREFEERLADSSKLAFRVAYSVLRHRQDAEDIAQEAFARAFQRFRQLRDRARFRAWIVRMTWRLALDRRRSDRRRAAREALHVSGSLPANVSAGQEREVRIWAAIDRLPEKLRVALVLASIEGHDIREVARLLDVPEGTVKSRLFLARQRLREEL